MLGLNNPAAKAGDLTAEEGLDVTIRVDDGDKTYYALLPFKDETREDYEKRLAEREKIVRDRKKVQNYYISYFDDRVTLDLIRAVKKEINPNYNPETDKEENKFSRK